MKSFPSKSVAEILPTSTLFSTMENSFVEVITGGIFGSRKSFGLEPKVKISYSSVYPSPSESALLGLVLMLFVKAFSTSKI